MAVTREMLSWTLAGFLCAPAPAALGGAPATQGEREGLWQKGGAIDQAFRAEGLSQIGVWEDRDLILTGRYLAMDVVRSNEGASVRRCDELIHKVEGAASLRRLADDALLEKGRVLFHFGNYAAARAAFQAVVKEFPFASYDLDRAGVVMIPGFAEERARFRLAQYYCLRHPNLSSDAARLGLAECDIATGNYAGAAESLANLSNVVQAEDPLVRPPERGSYEDYVQFMEAEPFRILASRRADKVALLWSARVEAIMGRRDQARASYEKFIHSYPTSAQGAVRELRTLDDGQPDEIAAALKDDTGVMAPAVPLNLSQEFVRDLLRESDVAKRIAGARRHFVEAGPARREGSASRPSSRP